MAIGVGTSGQQGLSIAAIVAGLVAVALTVSNLTATSNITVGVASTTTGQIILKNGTNAFNTILQPGTAVASRTYTLPTDFGAAGGALTDTAGNGTLAWTVPSSVSLAGTNVWTAQNSYTTNGTTKFTIPVVGATFTGVRTNIVGAGAGAAVVGADDCCFFGDTAGLANIGADRNSFFGSAAGAIATTGDRNCCFGYASDLIANSSTQAVSVGAFAGSSSNSVSIGYLAGATGQGSIALGVSSSASANNEFVAGSTTQAVANVYFGKGKQGASSAAGTAWTLNGNGGGDTTADQNGADVYLAGGKGTGTGNAGYFGFKYPLKSTTSTTLQTLSTAINYAGGFLYVTTADVTLTASTATTGTVIGAQTSATPQGTLTLDAGMLRVGSVIRIKGYGLITQSAAGPTFKFDAKLGAVVIASGTITANAGGVTSAGVEVEAVLICRSLGASGTVMGDGKILADTSVSTYASEYIPLNKAVTTVDTTASNVIDLFGTWSANTAGNAITMTNVTVEYR